MNGPGSCPPPVTDTHGNDRYSPTCAGWGWWPGCQTASSGVKGFSPAGRRRSLRSLISTSARSRTPVDAGASGGSAGGRSRHPPRGCRHRRPPTNVRDSGDEHLATHHPRAPPARRARPRDHPRGGAEDCHRWPGQRPTHTKLLYGGWHVPVSDRVRRAGEEGRAGRCRRDRRDLAGILDPLAGTMIHELGHEGRVIKY